MSTALQFTSVFNPASPPQKLKAGGMGKDTTPVAASKALEASGIKTQAIKDLETPPPVSVADKSENLPMPQTLPFFRQENRPEDFTKEFPMMKFQENKPLNLMPQEVPMSPELLMVMNSLNNMGGIMATPMREETGLAALAKMNYIDKV
tara:strand:+ start:393 stop:839 length:447 start_codon:yes stop_codon:yes gene_type:complete